MKLYPFDLPEGVGKDSWMLLGFGLLPEQIAALDKHLFEDLGLRLNSEWSEYTFSWCVGLNIEGQDREDVGDVVDIPVAENGAVRVVDGVLPPGVRLNRRTGRIEGVLTHTGLYSCTVLVGPAVKFDPLGGPGGPGDPGVWIPVDQPRAETVTALGEFPATVDDLDDSDKDRLLAELLAWRDGQTIRGADYGD